MNVQIVLVYLILASFLMSCQRTESALWASSHEPALLYFKLHLTCVCLEQFNGNMKRLQMSLKVNADIFLWSFLEHLLRKRTQQPLELTYFWLTQQCPEALMYFILIRHIIRGDFEHIRIELS